MKFALLAFSLLCSCCTPSDPQPDCRAWIKRAETAEARAAALQSENVDLKNQLKAVDENLLKLDKLNQH